MAKAGAMLAERVRRALTTSLVEGFGRDLTHNAVEALLGVTASMAS